MSFRLPDFNIICNIWTNANPPPAVWRVQSICQLRAPMRSNLGQDPTGQDWSFEWLLCLPPRVDVRDLSSTSNSDIVEVPATSGRFYYVMHADDVARGFANEYRIAVLRKKIPFQTPML